MNTVLCRWNSGYEYHEELSSLAGATCSNRSPGMAQTTQQLSFYVHVYTAKGQMLTKMACPQSILYTVTTKDEESNSVYRFSADTAYEDGRCGRCWSYAGRKIVPSKTWLSKKNQQTRAESAKVCLVLQQSHLWERTPLRNKPWLLNHLHVPSDSCCKRSTLSQATLQVVACLFRNICKDAIAKQCVSQAKVEDTTNAGHTKQPMVSNVQYHLQKLLYNVH